MSLKRAAAIILIFCLVALSAAPLGARADETGLCYIALNEAFADGALAYFSGSAAYVPIDCFADFKLYNSYHAADDTATLFSSSKQLFFELDTGRTYDSSDNYYNTSAIRRNGQVYVPVSFVCSQFGFSYSIIEGVGYGDVCRIKDSSYTLSDSQFLSAAESLMRSLYEQYSGGGISAPGSTDVVQPGDMVLVPGEPRRLLGSRVTGAALDDRAGCAVLIRCAQLLQGEDLHCRVSLLLSAREELDSQGARTAAFREEPDMAIVVDVSFAQQPGVPAHESGKLSAGPMIGVSPILDKGITNTLRRLAKEQEIPFQMEVMGGRTGTNADGINGSRGGVPCGLVSIPQRNMHTPAEICDLEDIENTARLLAAFIREVEA